MMKSIFFGAAAAIIAAMASPASAQEAIQAPGVNAQTYPWAVDRTGRIAAGGGATGPADAIATAPIRGANAYAYVGGGRSDDDFAQFGDRPVSRRTTCGLQSGATYLGPDGRWYPC